jgi:hypothetical protein
MLASCGLLATLLLLADPPPAPTPTSLRGEAILLSEVLSSLKVEADASTLEGQVVIRTAEGAIVPILSDPSSRALFLDERMRHRPLEINARRFAGLPHLQVTLFRIEEGGRLRIPEYYCDVCTISVRYPQTCPCCQGPMELRMKPEEP